MSAITTHVLDTAAGRPAAGVPVRLEAIHPDGVTVLGDAVTDDDGRVADLGPDRIDATELAEETAEPELSVTLGRGGASTHLYFSDLTYDYVRINAEYRT